MTTRTKRVNPLLVADRKPLPIVWLTTAEAADRIGLNPKTLMNWRAKQKADQPRFHKMPGTRGRVRYTIQDIDAWLSKRVRQF